MLPEEQIQELTTELGEKLRLFLALVEKKSGQLSKVDWYLVGAYGERCVEILDKLREVDPQICLQMSPSQTANLLATALRTVVATVMSQLAAKK